MEEIEIDEQVEEEASSNKNDYFSPGDKVRTFSYCWDNKSKEIGIVDSVHCGDSGIFYYVSFSTVPNNTRVVMRFKDEVFPP